MSASILDPVPLPSNRERYMKSRHQPSGMLNVRWLLLSGAFLLTRGIFASEQPYRIENSVSPDGKIELWVKPVTGEGIAAGVVQVRQIKTDKELSTFEWYGFGVRLVMPDPPFEVLWRQDSQYFAIKYQVARGWTTGTIYGRGSKGQWLQVKTPSDDYMRAIKKMSGVTELYGKGCDRPVKWTKGGELILEFVDRNLIWDHEDLEKEFLVTLKVAGRAGRPLKTARVLSIREKSKVETVRELNER